MSRSSRDTIAHIRRSASSTSISTNSSTRNSSNSNSNTPSTRGLQLAANEHGDLDWRYLSATEAYSSEYSAHTEEEKEEEEDEDEYKRDHGSTMDQLTEKLVSSSIQHHRGLGTRPLLLGPSAASSVRKSSTSPPVVASGLLATSPGKTSHEADDSTDTIKSMRARALDKINGRKPSTSSASASSYSNMGSVHHHHNYNNTNGANGNGVSSAISTKGAATKPMSSSSSNHSSSTRSPSAAMEEKSAPRQVGQSHSLERMISGTSGGYSGGAGGEMVGVAGTPIKVKRGLVGYLVTTERPSALLRSSSNSNHSRVSHPEAHHTIPTTSTVSVQQPGSNHDVQKRHSGSLKSHQQQQVLLTSEDEVEVTGTHDHSQDRDRTRNTTEGGGDMLVSELKALKARVQELEMERMNRSLSHRCVQSQSPQIIDAPQQNESYAPKDQEQRSSTSWSHPEKLQHTLGRHHGLTACVDSFAVSSSPLRYSVPGATKERQAFSSAGTEMGRLELSAKTDSPFRPSTLSSLTLQQQQQQQQLQPTTQHVMLLQEAFKTFEKAISVSNGSSSSSMGVPVHPSIQAMSKVISNTINMNQIIRTWIKADVALVDSSSMAALQRASDEQIRSLTESLLAMATTWPSLFVSGVADRSLTHSEVSTSGSNGGMASNRSYSPRMSTGSMRFARDQRLSLAGTMSSRESSPPQETASRLGISTQQQQYRQMYATSSQNGRHQAMVKSPRAKHTPYLHLTSQLPTPLSEGSISHGESGGGSGADVSMQLARRQASVRNIMARYSQLGSLRTPAFGQSSGGSQDLQQRHESAMAQSLCEYASSQAGFYENVEDRHLKYQQPQQQPLDRDNISNNVQYNALTGSVEFSPVGHTRSISTSRRPLSQQELHSFSRCGAESVSESGAGSRMSTIMPPPHLSQDVIVQRSDRYAHDKFISGDESMAGWSGISTLDRQQQNQRSSRQGANAVPLQQLRGHHEQFQQLQPLHQQLELVEQQQLQQQQMQQQHHLKQDQKHLQRHFAHHQHQHHHQDMMMTTPAMASPNSSPSSSSRLDAPSVVSSNSHHGGLASVDGRYHLSPRGSITHVHVDPASFPQQQSLSNISAMSDDGLHDSTTRPRSGLSFRRSCGINDRGGTAGVGAKDDSQVGRGNDAETSTFALEVSEFTRGIGGDVDQIDGSDGGAG
ncbi:hypothetical protein EDD11_002700 [Mortierella claussenii]|nr:hypothetical protein EDD11_002700 [Mortierella claussenii]